MEIDTCHFTIHVHSIEAAKAFYVDQLGFEVLQETPANSLLAVQAGTVLLSIVADVSLPEVDAAAKAGAQVIFRTPSLEDTVEVLKEVGLQLSSVSEAPGFMKYVTLNDPSGNRVAIAEYLRDPLQRADPIGSTPA